MYYHSEYLLDEPLPRLQLLPQHHLQGLEQHHDGVRGDDSVALADSGDEDAGQTDTNQGY